MVISEFTNRVTGQLSIISGRIGAAFMLGWNAAILSSNEGKSLEEFSAKAGFSMQRKNETNMGYVDRLIREAENKLSAR